MLAFATWLVTTARNRNSRKPLRYRFCGYLGKGIGEKLLHGTRAKVAVRLAGDRVERVFESTKALRAWRGPDQTIWVLEGTRTWRIRSLILSMKG